MNGTAFSRVDGVKIKIERLLKPSNTSLNSVSREILNLVYKQVDSFEEIAKITLDTSLDESISSEVNILEGLVDEIDSIFESNEDGVGISIEEVEYIKQRIHSFTPCLKMEEQRCSDGLYNLIPSEKEEEEEEEEEEGEGEKDDVRGDVIGLSDVYEELKRKVFCSPVTSLVGMPGIGKTALAAKFFHDPCYNYDRRVWIHVGKSCRVRDIPRRILAEVDPDSLEMLPEGDEEAVHECLKACFNRQSYLIVLDDVWDRFATYLLSPQERYKWNELDHPFLPRLRVNRILLTSRLEQLNEQRMKSNIFSDTITMRLLNKEESWDLLREKVFCKGLPCPPQLEKAGKKISENCDGLPLTILTIARLLSKEETSTLEYWNEVAEKKNHQIFQDAYRDISKVLLPSYTYLSHLLQMCFLFIGLFPQNQEIPRSKLINLWMADRFSELNTIINSHFDAIDCLEELISNNVVMVHKKSTFTYSHTVKTCGLHSSLWYLSRQKDRETKFALVLSNPNDCLGDIPEGYHRLSFNNNVLFGFKEVNKLVEDNCASTVRSLLCFGPYHQYQVPLCFRLKLLRELDALSIRFYEFPMEVLQLIRLKYLALTSNGVIPPSISQLSQAFSFLSVIDIKT